MFYFCNSTNQAVSSGWLYLLLAFTTAEKDKFLVPTTNFSLLFIPNLKKHSDLSDEKFYSLLPNEKEVDRLAFCQKSGELLHRNLSGVGFKDSGTFHRKLPDAV